MNKSLSTVIHLGFRDLSCGGGFQFTNTVTLTEQLNRIYGVPFLLPIFVDVDVDVDGFLRNSAENLPDNIIADFYSQNQNKRYAFCTSDIIFHNSDISAPRSKTWKIKWCNFESWSY